MTTFHQRLQELHDKGFTTMRYKYQKDSLPEPTNVAAYITHGTSMSTPERTLIDQLRAQSHQPLIIAHYGAPRDVGKSGQIYADTYRAVCDAAIVDPWDGVEGLLPWIQDPDHGIPRPLPRRRSILHVSTLPPRRPVHVPESHRNPGPDGRSTPQRRSVCTTAIPPGRQSAARIRRPSSRWPLEVHDQELLELAAAQHNGLTFHVVPTRPPEHN